MPLFINFENTLTSISLNVSNIKLKEDSNINKSKNFNIKIQIYLILERKHKEFIIIEINLNTTKKNDEKHPYNKDHPYLEPNNVKHYRINYIYNYYALYLRLKTTNNFFLRTMFRSIRKTYREEETRH